MKLTLLGTGNAQATCYYNTCFTLQESDRVFLVDAGGGNGIFQQLLRVNLDWKSIHEIFITHKHIDHLLGVVWMLRRICQSMTRKNYDGQVTLYGHQEVIEILHSIAKMVLDAKDVRFIGDRVHLIVVTDHEEREVFGHPTTFFDVHSTKAKQFGFQMKLEKSNILTCCGDEPYNEKEEQYVAPATWLMHEAFCLDADASIFKPYEKHHSTVKDACELAQRFKIPNLILYHTEDRSFPRRQDQYLTEGQRYYHGNLLIPNDLDEIDLAANTHVPEKT